jgi:hypothetical protein
MGGGGLEGGEEKNRCVCIHSWEFGGRVDALCSVVIKVGMVGDSQIGKTSLMVKYVEGSFDEDYIQTLGTFRNSCPILCFRLRCSRLQA